MLSKNNEMSIIRLYQFCRFRMLRNGRVIIVYPIIVAIARICGIDKHVTLNAFSVSIPEKRIHTLMNVFQNDLSFN